MRKNLPLTITYGRYFYKGFSFIGCKAFASRFALPVRVVSAENQRQPVKGLTQNSSPAKQKGRRKNPSALLPLYKPDRQDVFLRSPAAYRVIELKSKLKLPEPPETIVDE